MRIPAANLKPLEDTATGTPEQITYVAAAARVAGALTQDVLLAPIESSVIPLPHQIRTLLSWGIIPGRHGESMAVVRGIFSGIMLEHLGASRACVSVLQTVFRSPAVSIS